MKLPQKLKGFTGRLWGVRIEPENDVVSHKPLTFMSESFEVQPKGGIRKAKKAEYDPSAHRKGGRVVKAMPPELRKVKEAQELIPDDEPVQQLPD